MVTRMQQRRGTASQWTTANTVLAAGEIGFETDTNKFKIGDGSTAWNSLPYFVNKNDIETGLLDTDEVSEGTTNLYFTAQRAIDAVANGSFTTDAVEEGTTNLYYTDARVETVIDNSTTDNISEGTNNLYFTDQRAIDAVGENLALNDLSDVATAGVADGDALVYDTATTSWVPGSVAIDALNDIADVNITDPANGEVLVYDNGNWVNQEASGGGIADIVTESETIIPAASSWTTVNSSFGTSEIYTISYGNNIWLAGGTNGKLAISTDASTWTQTTSPVSSGDFYNSIAFGNQTFLAGGRLGTLYRSTDGTSWTTVTINVPVYNDGKGNISPNDITDIIYATDIWALSANTSYSSGIPSTIHVSTDSITWVTRNPLFGDVDITSISYGNNLFVATGTTGRLHTSTDTITWVTQTSNFGNTTIRSVAYGNNVWAAFGDNGHVRSSTDGSTWTTQTTIGQTIVDAQYSDSLWVAIGGSVIRTSTDLVTWTTQNSNFGNTTIQDIAYGNSLWVAGGSNGQLRTSSSITQIIPPDQTLSLADAGDLIQIDSSVPTVITVPLNSSVAIPVKTEITIVRRGTGSVTISPASGVTLNATPGLKLRERWSVATLIKINTDEWLITGDLSA